MSRRGSGRKDEVSVPRLLPIALAALLLTGAAAPASAGLLEFLFGGGHAPAYRPRAAEPAPRHREARAPRSHGQILCVRRCDGFYFPLGGSAGSLAAAQPLCEAACPDTVPFMLSWRGPNENIDDARDAAGARYGDQPFAYSYRKAAAPSCGCKPPGGYLDWARRVLDDKTLRKGDIVATPNGASVFKGAGRGEPDASDFVDMSSPGALPSGALAQADRVLGFSFRAEMARRAAAEAVRTAGPSNEITVTATTSGKPAPEPGPVQKRGLGRKPARVILDLPYSHR